MAQPVRTKDPREHAAAVSPEPVAIVGIGCRFGRAQSPAEFWSLLCAGTDAVGEIPAARFQALGVESDPRPGTPGKVVTRQGMFFDRVDLFDAGFFGISPRESACMDPQHRLLLEVAWEAMEDAGALPEHLTAGRTGSYVGLWSGDYEHHLFNLTRRQELYMAIGGGRASAAGRVAFALNLQGPALTVDTGCSSSLVAIHLACQSIRSGECAMALAGGVNLILDPGVTLAYSRAGMLSPDGRCKFGDARANGYVRSEGCGVVVLKPLSRAVSDGDRIYAKILGGAVNNDGRQGFFVTPSGLGQEALLREAYTSAGVDPARVCYVEAHGTGTAVGDPVETQALGKILGAGLPSGPRCAIGSVKTNIGHTEAAAGVAGLIKATLALHHGLIPPSLHFQTPNPNIPWKQLPFVVQRELGPLPDQGGSAVAAVNSFGITGTNAHVILQQAPALSAGLDPTPKPGIHLLTISAKSDEALEAMRQQWIAFLGQSTELGGGRENGATLADIAYTAAARRVHHERKLAVVGATRQEMIEQLQMRERATQPGESASPAKAPLVFVFSGQGPQWHAMGRELFLQEPVYRAAIERCSQLLQPLTGWSLVEELSADESHSRLGQTAVAQPALFALQLGLVELWRSWGIKPDAVIGHSIGEVAAAVTSGALSLEAGLHVVAHRGRVMQQATGLGRMAAIGVGADEAGRLKQAYGEKVSIGAINSPSAVTLSGEGAALEEIVSIVGQRGLFARMLKVNYAFHSATLDPYRDELAAALSGLEVHAAKIPIWSTVTGDRAVTGAFDAQHWAAGIRQPVLFGPATQSLLHAFAESPVTFLEIGPHPVLATSLSDCLANRAKPGKILATLRREQNESGTMRAALGGLYEQEHPINWPALYPSGRRCVSLPAYAWQREKFWIDDAEFSDAGATKAPTLTGGFWQSYLATPGSQGAHYWETAMTSLSPRGVADHRIHETVAMPAVGLVALALGAAEQAFGRGRHAVQAMELREALVLSEAPRIVQLGLESTLPGTLEVRVSSRSSDSTLTSRDWTLHAVGTLLLGEAPVDRELIAPRDYPQATGREKLTGDAFYQEMARRGLNYGPSFRPVLEFCRDATTASATLRADAHLAWGSGQSGLAVDALDACLQALVALAPTPDTAWVPVRIGRCAVHSPLRENEPLRVYASRRSAGNDATTFVGDVGLVDAAGRQLISFSNVTLQNLESVRVRPVTDWLHEIDWVSVPRSGAGNAGAAELLPAPDLIGRQLEAARNLGSSTEASSATVLRELDGVCGEFVVRALRQLGWSLREGERQPVTELAGRLGIVPRHQRLLDRLMEILLEDGVVRRDGDEFVVTRSPGATDPDRRLQEMLGRFPTCQTELTILGRCAGKLDRVLAGHCDPLQLLFPEGSLESAGQLYQDSSFSRACNAMVRAAVQAIAAAVPAGRTLRVLEIGGGTGGTTAHALPLLPPGRTHYVFTDVSSLFTTRAAEKFREFPFVDYRVLDISANPADQGFGGEEYDLIIAANVLHATPDLRRTLRTARDLLAPGGEVLLVEGVERSRWIDLIFGLIEGWWLFEDRDLRASHPLLARDRWPGVLREVGLATPVTVANTAEKNGALFEQAVIVARKPAAGSGTATNRWLVFADHGGTGSQLGLDLAQRAVEAVLVRPGDAWDKNLAGYTVRPGEVADFARVVAEVSGEAGASLSGIAYLWPLDVNDGSEAAAAQQITCDSLAALTQALSGVQGEAARFTRGARLWIVTRGTQNAGGAVVNNPLAAPAWGVGRVIALEHPALRCTLVDLDGTQSDIAGLADEMLGDEASGQVCLRKSGRFEARVVRCDLGAGGAGTRLSLPSHRAYRLTTRKPGTFDALEYQAVSRRQPERGEIEIQVAAAGLNFRDVFMALGMLPGSELALGLDAAGVVTAVGEDVCSFAVGDDVMAFAGGAFGSFVTVRQELVARRPAGLTFEQAAALPVVFLTAQYALGHLARLRRGDRVLIHAASGGVGMAAVQFARLAGCEIFGSASTPRKRELLREMGVQHVLDSRSLAFADEVLALTDGRGVDVVLNSLAGEYIARSFAALAPAGRFIEIGKTGVWSQDQARAARPGAFYQVFDLVDMGRREPELIRAIFAQIVQLFENHQLQPLPVELFPAERITDAFRAMSQARHVGKIVITQPRSPAGTAAKPPDEAVPREGAALITGGYGGLGLLLADWLFAQGCRHLILMGRRGPDERAIEKIAALEKAGAVVKCARGDVAKELDLRAVLDEAAQTMPPLASIFHCAGALDDGVLAQMNPGRFRTVLEPKLLGARWLDRLTRALPIRRFVMFSSWASVFGSPGQANHSAANAYLDALAHARRAQGLPAQSINWGPWTEIGAAAAYADRLGSRGIGCFSPAEGLRALEIILRSDREQVAVVPFEVEKWLAASATAMRTRLFERLQVVEGAVKDGKAEAPSGKAKGDVRRAITAAQGERQQGRVMDTWLREQAAAVLRLPLSRVETGKPLKSLGFDSLLAVEFRNRLESSLGLQLPATLIWNYPTLAQLGPNLLERLVPPAAPAVAEPGSIASSAAPVVVTAAGLADLSDDEAEKQLEQRLKEMERNL